MPYIDQFESLDPTATWPEDGVLRISFIVSRALLLVPGRTGPQLSMLAMLSNFMIEDARAAVGVPADTLDLSRDAEMVAFMADRYNLEKDLDVAEGLPAPRTEELFAALALWKCVEAQRYARWALRPEQDDFVSIHQPARASLGSNYPSNEFIVVLVADLATAAQYLVEATDAVVHGEGHAARATGIKNHVKRHLSQRGRDGAEKRHQETKRQKKQAQEWFQANGSRFGSINKAAEEYWDGLTWEDAPALRTVYDWMRERK